MAAELQAILDGLSYEKRTINEPMKILLVSIEAILAIRSDQKYKGGGGINY